MDLMFVYMASPLCVIRSSMALSFPSVVQPFALVGHGLGMRLRIFIAVTAFLLHLYDLLLHGECLRS